MPVPVGRSTRRLQHRHGVAGALVQWQTGRAEHVIACSSGQAAQHGGAHCQPRRSYNEGI